MRAQIIEAIKQHAKGQLEKHKANVEVHLNNPVGVASHPDHIETINKELKSMAQYDEQLDMIDKYFEYKDPFKNK